MVKKSQKMCGTVVRAADSISSGCCCGAASAFKARFAVTAKPSPRRAARKSGPRRHWLFARVWSLKPTNLEYCLILFEPNSSCQFVSNYRRLADAQKLACQRKNEISVPQADAECGTTEIDESPGRIVPCRLMRPNHQWIALKRQV